MKKILLITGIATSVACSAFYIGHAISKIQDSRNERILTKMMNIINNFNYNGSKDEMLKELNQFKKLNKKQKRLYKQAKINPFMETLDDVEKNNEIIINSFIENVEKYLKDSAEVVEVEVIED